ncbi:MAG: tRNA uridine-5-carboxymethylaminomethyl(34) synthesis GTPase MnmE [Leptospirales bacterium]
MATPIGHSAIATLRLTGESTLALVEKIFQPAKKQVKLKDYPRISLLGNITFNNELIDEVILVPFLSPYSFTGEEMAEIHCHGNPLIVKKIIQALYKSGFEPARPGDFSRRAVLNGKIDLTQAEAILEIIEARGERELQKAQLMKEGSFRNELLRFRSSLLNLAADLSAELDFIEEDIQFQEKPEKIRIIDEICNEVKILLKNSEQMQILRSGYEAVLLGAPNAGKSSLLNYLIGKDRAIVSELPGTTRDYLESELQISGMPVKFVDTAGLRKATDDNTENLGMKRSKEKYKESDICLLLIDSSIAPENQLLQELDDLIANNKSPILVLVLNKWDIVQEEWLKSISSKQALKKNLIVAGLSESVVEKLIAETHHISITQQLNTEELRDRLSTLVENLHPHTGSILLAGWQTEIMEKMYEELLKMSDAIKLNELAEIVVSHIQNCIDFMSELTGEITNEELLGRIFSRFCIGK